MAGTAADLSGMLTGIASTVGEMGKPASALFQNLGAPLPDPNDPKSMEEYAAWLQKMGRNDEALQYMQGARAAEASTLAAGREKREKMAHIEAEQTKAIAQTYFSLKDKPDEREKWIAAMQEAGKGQIIDELQQREVKIAQAQEQHQWQRASAEARARSESDKQMQDNIMKSYMSIKDPADREKFLGAMDEAGKGDYTQPIRRAMLSMETQREQLDRARREKGVVLDSDFFGDSDEGKDMYAKYQKMRDAGAFGAATQLASTYATGQFQQALHKESAGVHKYELDNARAYLEKVNWKDEIEDFGIGNIDDFSEAETEALLTQVVEFNKKKGYMPKKEDMMQLLANYRGKTVESGGFLGMNTTKVAPKAEPATDLPEDTPPASNYKEGTVAEIGGKRYKSVNGQWVEV